MYAPIGFSVMHPDDLIVEATLNLLRVYGRNTFAEKVTDVIATAVKDRLEHKSYAFNTTSPTWIINLFRPDQLIEMDVVHLVLHVLKGAKRVDSTIPRIVYRSSPVLSLDELLFRTLRGKLPTPRFPASDVKMFAGEISLYMYEWLSNMVRAVEMVQRARQAAISLLRDIKDRVSSGQGVSQFEKTFYLLAATKQLRTAVPASGQFDYSAFAVPPEQRPELVDLDKLVAKPMTDPTDIVLASALPGLCGEGPMSRWTPWISTRQRTALMAWIGPFASSFTYRTGDWALKQGAFVRPHALNTDSIEYTQEDLLAGLAQSTLSFAPTRFRPKNGSSSTTEDVLQVALALNGAGPNPAIAPDWSTMQLYDDQEVDLIAVGPDKDLPTIKRHYLSHELRRGVTTNDLTGYVAEQLLINDRIGAGGVEGSSIPDFDIVDMRGLQMQTTRSVFSPALLFDRLSSVNRKAQVVIADASSKSGVVREIDFATHLKVLDAQRVIPALAEYVHPPVEWLLREDPKAVDFVAGELNLPRRVAHASSKAIGICYQAWRLKEMFGVQPSLPPAMSSVIDFARTHIYSGL